MSSTHFKMWLTACEGGQQMRKIRIGAGAGFPGDRIEPAVELAEKGDIDYLVSNAWLDDETELVRGLP